MQGQVLQGEPLVEVTRGDLVESVHRVAACAVDASGAVVDAVGETDVPVYLRSTAKPFIAAAAIAAGARERFGLEPEEIAVMAASHSGEPFHVDAVRSILRKIGMEESALLCGSHAPYNAKAAHDLERAGIRFGAVHNNCSGKHAGILALCKIIGADPATYLDLENPAQQRILELCARLSDQRVEDFKLGVDGCGIPVYATPLRNAALSFARLATLEGVCEEDALALEIVRSAMIAHPEYVSGTGEFDTRLMEVAAGSICCKGGAEGVHGDSLITAGLGFVLKVVDGASRGRAPAVLASLRRLGVLGEAELEPLADFAEPVVYNRAGRKVGVVRAARTTVAVEKAGTEKHLV
ncbi:MAG: asparaginase [Vulcanimicrobiaceae bacterium]